MFSQVTTLRCRSCGSVPAVDVKFRAVQSVLIWISDFRELGPWCRDCGTAVFRDLQQRMLTFGWYEVFSWLPPVVLLLNWAAMRKVAGLTAPQPGCGPALDPGRPLLRRPTAVAGVVVPIVAVTAWVVRVSSQPPTP